MSRAPDFILKGMNKVTGDKSQKIGAAWANEDGTITLVLDMFVKIESHPDIVYTLFVNDGGEAVPQKRKKPRNDHPTIITKGSTWHP